MNSKQIRVTCDTKLHVPLDELNAIQGKLKQASVEDYEKFRKIIVERGINFSLHVWKELDGTKKKAMAKWWIIDGHLRKLMLTKMRDEDGYDVPPLPCVEIEATSFKDAKRQVLAASSQFHKTNRDGLYEFMHDAEVSMEELKAYELPGIDLPKFEAEFFKELQPAQTNPEEHWENLPEFNGPDARIRLILTFIDKEKREAFLQFLGVAMEHVRNPNSKCWSLLWPVPPKEA